MKRISLIIALALAACGQAQYSNQATQRWTEMRLAALEAKLRADMNLAVVGTDYSTAQEFTNAVQSVAAQSAAQFASAMNEVYSSNFAAAMSGHSVTQYVVYAASDAAKLVAGLTNSLPVGARFTIKEYDYEMQSTRYYTADRKAQLVFYSESEGAETMGTLLVNANTSSERDFAQSTDRPSMFTQYYPSSDEAVYYVIMKTTLAR